MHEVLEFAAIIYDTHHPVARADAPQFRVLIQPTFAQASPTALRMNEALVQELRAPTFDTVVLSPDELVDRFTDFLLQHGFRWHERGRIRVQAAGKNFDKFDRIFLERLPGFRQKISFHRVALDPGLLYWNPAKDKQWIPNMVACKKRAGFTDTDRGPPRPRRCLGRDPAGAALRRRRLGMTRGLGQVVTGVRYVA